MSRMVTNQVEVFFQGAKPYWRTRNNMDIILVHHLVCDVIEVISYEPTFDKEAPRIYLNNAVLCTKLDNVEIERKLEEAKEPFLRRREVPDSAGLLKDLVNSAKTDYILNRLHIMEFDAEKKEIKMEIQLNFRDFDDAEAGGVAVNSVVCERPKRLQLYKSPHYRTLLEGMVDQMLETLEEDKSGIKMLRRRAHQYEGAADQFLNFRDRWRVPIIFVKVKNGRILTPADARIWRIVTRALDNEVTTLAVGRVLDVAVPERVDSTPENKPAALGLKLSVALPSINTSLDFQGKSPTSVAAPTPTHRRGSKSSFSDHGSTNASPAITPQNGRSPMGRNGFARSPFARNNTAASSSSLLAGITASMKKRFGMASISNEEEENEANEPPNGDTTAAPRTTSTASPTTQKLRRKSQAAPEADAVNPRGTNISITPKPRSYFTPTPTPKKARPGGRSFALTTRSESSDAERSGTQSPDLAAQSLDPNGVKEDTDADTFGSSSLSQRISAGFAAFSTSFKRTLSFKPKLHTAQSLAVIQGDDDEDIGFEREHAKQNETKAVSAGTNGEGHSEGATAALTGSALDSSAQPGDNEFSIIDTTTITTTTTTVTKVKKEITIVVQESSKPGQSPKASPTPKSASKSTNPYSHVHSRVASMRSGATLDTSRTGTNSDADLLNAAVQEPAPQSAEDYRDAMLKKQSDNTAKTRVHLNSRASFRENMYALPDSGAESSSPVAQFFSRMPWMGSGKVVPSE